MTLVTPHSRILIIFDAFVSLQFRFIFFDHNEI